MALRGLSAGRLAVLALLAAGALVLAGVVINRVFFAPGKARADAAASKSGAIVAQGEIVLVNDRYGIRLTRVVPASERMKNI